MRLIPSLFVNDSCVMLAPDPSRGVEPGIQTPAAARAASAVFLEKSLVHGESLLGCDMVVFPFMSARPGSAGPRFVC